MRSIIVSSTGQEKIPPAFDISSEGQDCFEDSASYSRARNPELTGLSHSSCYHLPTICIPLHKPNSKEMEGSFQGLVRYESHKLHTSLTLQKQVNQIREDTRTLNTYFYAARFSATTTLESVPRRFLRVSNPSTTRNFVSEA